MLSRSMPLLFGVPVASDSRRAIVLSIIILSLSFLSYLATEHTSSFNFFMILTFLIGLHGYICLTTTAANILYLVRYFLVWILVFGTAIIWYIYDGEVLVAPFGVSYQTVANTRIVVLAGVFSLCGSLIGWHKALLRFKFKEHTEFFISDRNRTKLIKTGAYIAVSFALLFVWKSGGIVSDGKTYADGEEGFTMTFGVFNIFHFIGIALMFLASIQDKKIVSQYLWLAIFTLILGMLAGSRADFLPQAFICILLFFNKNVVCIFEKKQYIKLVLWFVLFLGTLFIAYFVATFIAIWRGGIDPLKVIDILLTNDKGLLINEAYGHKMLYFETGNMMLGGLYAAIYNVDNGGTGFLFGKSYADYFLIAPPGFLNLPRPLGLEWYAEIGGQPMSIGGIFEVAEAYWNFGLFGCFFVSLFISYTFGWLLRRGLKANNYFFLVWFMVFGLHGFRSIWYQNFSYFRLMTVMLFVYVVSLFLFKWFIIDRRGYLILSGINPNCMPSNKRIDI